MQTKTSEINPAQKLGAIARADKTILFGIGLFILLLVLNLLTNPSTFNLRNLPITIGFAAPIILVAFAAMPSMLLGNGGIDLSIGPAMGLVNVVTVYIFAAQLGVTSFALVAVALGVGILVGLLNGFLVAVVRIQPIVATLGTYLLRAGLALVLAPTPGGSVPNWLASLAGRFSWVPILAAVLIWMLFRRFPIYEHLMCYAGDERAVYTSGINVALIRLVAFTMGGIFAGLAGLSLAAVLGSADPTVGTSYTMLGIAAAALGGISLMGGRGGMIRALVGALTIFLLQNLLTFWNVSTFVLQIAYGLVLVLAVSINGQIGKLLHRSKK